MSNALLAGLGLLNLAMGSPFNIAAGVFCLVTGICLAILERRY